MLSPARRPGAEADRGEGLARGPHHPLAPSSAPVSAPVSVPVPDSVSVPVSVPAPASSPASGQPLPRCAGLNKPSVLRFVPMLIRPLLVAVALAAAAPACKSKAADCAAVGNKVVALIRAELERETDGEEKRRRESMLPALKEELESKCKAEKWSEVARSCIDHAGSIADLEKCDPDRRLDKASETPPDAGP